MFSDFGLRWSRRSTLAFVAFAVIVVAFTALALSWNGLSVFRNSATAEPAIGPFIIGIPITATPTPTPAPSPHPAVVKSPAATHAHRPKPTLSPHPKATHKTKTKHKGKVTHKPKAKVTHKPKPIPTPKSKHLYIHTPKAVHPKRKAQYPPAAPLTTFHGVLSGAAGDNWVAH